MKLLPAVVAAMPLAFLAACTPPEEEVDATEVETTEADTDADTMNTSAQMDETTDEESEVPVSEPLRQPEEGEEVAVLTTSMGEIVVMFYPEKAPAHVEAFKNLARDDFYDGTRFHRVLPGFMIQGGDPLTKEMDQADMWGTGGPGYNLEAEFNDIAHRPGVLSAARSPDPDSAGSQFFIMHGRKPELDGQYTAYGQVLEGMDVVHEIVNVETVPQPGNPTEKSRPVDPPTIDNIEIVTWPIEDSSDQDSDV
jgi:peptidyl-prolyl cis-trans isomerase B (cyclophilin B)